MAIHNLTLVPHLIRSGLYQHLESGSGQALPEMPSAAEVEKNGADLGELHKAMLKQLEELTLQVIALKKEVETLKTTK